MANKILFDNSRRLGDIMTRLETPAEFVFFTWLTVEGAWSFDSPLYTLRNGLVRVDGKDGDANRIHDLRAYIVDHLMSSRLLLVNSSLGCGSCSHVTSFLRQTDLKDLLELFAGRLADHVAVCMVHARTGSPFRKIIAEYKAWKWAYPGLSFKKVLLGDGRTLGSIETFYRDVFKPALDRTNQS